MAKAIVKGVRFNETTYVAGDETALEALLTQTQVDYLIAQGAITGDWTPAGGGATPAAVVLRIGATPTEGLETVVLEETVTLTNAVKTDLATQIPAAAIILCVQGNLKTAVVGDASGDDGLVKVAVGTAADPDIYGKTTTLAKNQKINMIPAAYAVLASALTISVYAVDTNGAAVTEKFVAAAQVRVRVTYQQLNSLDDVA